MLYGQNIRKKKKMGKLTITDGTNTYTIENCPEHISQIVSITIPTKDIETKLYVPIFLSHIEIKSQLQSLEDFLYKENDFANLSIADIYDEIDDVTDIEYSEWIEFNDRFWDDYFQNDENYSAAEKAAKAVYFGHIRSWNDNFVKFNSYGNLESQHNIDINDYDEEIIEQWIVENWSR